MTWKNKKDDISEDLKLNHVINEFLQDMGKMIVGENPDYDQYYRAIDHLRAMLSPYSDDKFTKEREKLKNAFSAACRTRNNKRIQMARFEYYQGIFEALNALAKRKGLGFTEEDEGFISYDKKKVTSLEGKLYNAFIN